MDVNDDGADREGLGRPEHERSGATVDEAVEKAEAGSQVEGEHTPSGQASEPGDSRIERLADVEERSTDNTGEAVPDDPPISDDAE